MWNVKIRYFLSYGFESVTDHLEEMQMAATKREEIPGFYTIGIFIRLSSEMNYGESLRIIST